jgi:preprotein translocase subunit SecA
VITFAQQYRQTEINTPKQVYSGLDGIIHSMSGVYKRYFSFTPHLKKKAEEIHAKGVLLCNCSSNQLQNQLLDLKRHFRRQSKNYQSRIPEALSLLSEVAHRTLGLRPYPVQIMGALALCNNHLAEMATGEGKTLMACLPSAIFGWIGKPNHIITVNDYLAFRDATHMTSFYEFCDITVGYIISTMSPEERRHNYAQDVVYTTSKEILADFLRDRLMIGHLYCSSRRLIYQLGIDKTQKTDDLVMRGLDTAIIDEADSVLIDEAVTPLIISTKRENKLLKEVVQTAHHMISDFEKNIHYTIDHKYREIILTHIGLQKLENETHTLTGMWKGVSRSIELIQYALSAKELYERDKNYVIQNGKIVIVDEFTGRLMPSRSWSHGLHQAIEIKENLEITDPTETLSRLSFQRFFRFFRKLSGMTGTAKESSGEFWHIYALPVVKIPTNRPCIRKVLPDKIFPDANTKWEAIVNDIILKHQSGCPVLVGTRNVQASEQLGEFLAEKSYSFNLLNAVKNQEEEKIVASAGEKGKITIATNMAGRGTDIKLGRGVKELGGLHVIATERHESGRIDRQLFGRCARQGDPGTSQAYISMDDEIIRRFVPESLKKSIQTSISNNLPFARFMAKRACAYAQQSSENLAYHQRKNVLKNDIWEAEALSFTGSDLQF